MTIRITLIAAACALSLAACGDRTPPPATDTAATPTTPTEPAPAAPAPTEPAAPAGTPPAADTTTPATPAPAATPPTDKPAAVVNNCATEIEGNDAIQYNVGSIAVPASCTEFTITLRHVGKMPVTAMGHNVVIAKTADVQAVAADGLAAGAAANYVKAGDARIVANTKMIGGGESTSMTFNAAKLKDGGPYTFFCSFPGHVATMKGTIAVE